MTLTSPWAQASAWIDRFTYAALPTNHPVRGFSTSHWQTSLRNHLQTWHKSRRAKIVLCAVLGLLLLGGTTVYSSGHNLLPVDIPLPAALTGSHPRTKKSQYIDAVLRNPVEGVLDMAPITRKCNETVFQEGLVWHCDTALGGMGNVGNEWLNCARYAIEAGATTMIIPTLGVRSEDDLLNLGSKENATSISALYDLDFFLESWNAACPQIRAVVSDADIPNLPSADTSPHLAPHKVKAFPMSLHILVDPTGWREAFDAWLARVKGKDRVISAAAPFRVWQDSVLFQWNRKAAQNPLDFTIAFARLWRYPDTTRRLAASVLWHLEQKLARPIVPDTLLDPKTAPGVANHLENDRIAPGTFLGVHLRVADDAVRVQWPGYKDQAPFYIAEAVARNLSAIYVATGSAEHRDRFRADAAAANVTVYTKEELLDGADLKALQALSWDQQALVEFDVLLRSAYFYGFYRSSFSWKVAMRRSSLPDAGDVTRPPRDEWRDNWSAIGGRWTRISPWAVWP